MEYVSVKSSPPSVIFHHFFISLTHVQELAAADFVRSKENSISTTYYALFFKQTFNPNRTPEKAIQMTLTLADFFREKVTKIRTSIQERQISIILDPMGNDEIHDGERLHVVKEVTQTEVIEKLLSTMSGKSSPMDFRPTSLLKECRKTFSIIIARLANISFSEGRFPSRFKAAQIAPLLKKEELDPKILSNYRPISNVNTVSKILERLFSAMLTPHVTSACCQLQSAYRRHHSVETALLRIK